MKKFYYLLIVALLTVGFSSCDSKKAEKAVADAADSISMAAKQGCCKKGEGKCCKSGRPDFTAVKESLANWSTMTDDAKTKVIAEAQALIDTMNARMNACKGMGEKMCKGMENLTEEQKAAMQATKAEMDAKLAGLQQRWAGLKDLSLDDQKALVEEIIDFSNMGCCKHNQEQEAEK